MNYTKEQRQAFRQAINAANRLALALDGAQCEAAQQACDALLALRYGPVDYPASRPAAAASAASMAAACTSRSVASRTATALNVSSALA